MFCPPNPAAAAVTLNWFPHRSFPDREEVHATTKRRSDDLMQFFPVRFSFRHFGKGAIFPGASPIEWGDLSLYSECGKEEEEKKQVVAAKRETRLWSDCIELGNHLCKPDDSWDVLRERWGWGKLRGKFVWSFRKYGCQKPEFGDVHFVLESEKGVDTWREGVCGVRRAGAGVFWCRFGAQEIGTVNNGGKHCGCVRRWVITNSFTSNEVILLTQLT